MSVRDFLEGTGASEYPCHPSGLTPFGSPTGLVWGGSGDAGEFLKVASAVRTRVLYVARDASDAIAILAFPEGGVLHQWRRDPIPSPAPPAAPLPSAEVQDLLVELLRKDPHGVAQRFVSDYEQSPSGATSWDPGHLAVPFLRWVSHEPGLSDLLPFLYQPWLGERRWPEDYIMDAPEIVLLVNQVVDHAGRLLLDHDRDTVSNMVAPCVEWARAHALVPGDVHSTAIGVFLLDRGRGERITYWATRELIARVREGLRAARREA